jgi:hypothetical protein
MEKLNSFYVFSMDSFSNIVSDSLIEVQEMENFIIKESFAKILVKNLVKNLGISFD